LGQGEVEVGKRGRWGTEKLKADKLKAEGSKNGDYG